MKKLIGKHYLPIDNSYSVNISQPTKHDKVWGHLENKGYLAGTSFLNDHPHLCEIVSEPFDCKVIFDVVKKDYIKTMVIVKDLSTGDYHTVLFFEKGLNVKERIEAINKGIEINGRKEPYFNPYKTVEYSEL